MPDEVGEPPLLWGFLHRLGQERPRFLRSPELGDAFLRLLFRSALVDPAQVKAIAEIKAVRQSVAAALQTCQSVRSSGGKTLVIQKGGDPLAVPTRVLESLLGPQLFRECLTESK